MFGRKRNRLTISEVKEMEHLKAENAELRETTENALIELAEVITTAIEEHENALMELAELMED